MQLFMLSFLTGASQDGSAGNGSFITTLIPFALIIGIFYFLIIRPQNKKQKETQRMLDALKKGDKVITIGGVHGVIQSAKEGSVIVKVDENTKMEFSRSAIASVSAEGKGEKIEEKKPEAGGVEEKNEGRAEKSDR
jgi:preprotein translocase subunit YajC